MKDGHTLNTNAAIFERGLAAAEPGPIDPVGLQFMRASGLAQARLQLAILSGNRQRALCEIDRLVEIDRKLETILVQGLSACAEISGEAMETHLARQKRAIATEKLALGAAIEFPRLAASRDTGDAADELLLGEEQGVTVVEDTRFARRLGLAAFWILALAVAGALLAVAVPILAAG